MSQTSYPVNPDSAFAGLIGDMQDYDAESRVAPASPAAFPFGIAVKQGASPDDSFDLPAALTDKVIGLLMYSNSQNNIGLVTLSATIPGASILASDRASVMSRGKMWVVPENAVAPGGAVFARFADSVVHAPLTQKGSLRADADGVAQVTTVTPTAVNATIYVLRVEFTDAPGSAVNQKNKVFEFEFLSDPAAATATNITTGFKNLLGADAEFTALVVASGTTTLILTGQVMGQVFVVHSEGDGTLAVAATTPAALTALRIPGARWETTASAGKPALMTFSKAAAQG